MLLNIKMHCFMYRGRFASRDKAISNGYMQRLHDLGWALQERGCYEQGRSIGTMLQVTRESRQRLVRQVRLDRGFEAYKIRDGVGKFLYWRAIRTT